MLWAVAGAGPVRHQPEPAEIIAGMNRSWGRIDGYRTDTEVTEFREGRISGVKRFRYSFRKPHEVRIEMEFPSAGTVLEFSGRDDTISVHPGWAGFLTFRLTQDSHFFRTDAGQRIDQTDLGMLIHNIARSLTDGRRSDISSTQRDGILQVEVVADDHFLPGVRTRYRFSIDTARWLPVEVREFTPNGIPRRTVIFRNLRTWSGMRDRTDGKETDERQEPLR